MQMSQVLVCHRPLTYYYGKKYYHAALSTHISVGLNRGLKYSPMHVLYTHTQEDMHTVLVRLRMLTLIQKPDCML